MLKMMALQLEYGHYILPEDFIIPLAYSKSISEDTQEMPHSQSTALLRHQKERWGTNDAGLLAKPIKPIITYNFVSNL